MSIICNRTRETARNVWLCVAQDHQADPEAHYFVPMIQPDV